MAKSKWAKSGCFVNLTRRQVVLWTGHFLWPTMLKGTSGCAYGLPASSLSCRASGPQWPVHFDWPVYFYNVWYSEFQEANQVQLLHLLFQNIIRHGNACPSLDVELVCARLFNHTTQFRSIHGELFQELVGIQSIANSPGQSWLPAHPWFQLNAVFSSFITDPAHVSSKSNLGHVCLRSCPWLAYPVLNLPFSKLISYAF